MPRPLYRVASNSYHALRFTVVHMGIEPLDSKVQIEKNVLRVSFGDLLISELKSAKGTNLLVPTQRYTYRVLQTIQMKLILLCV